MFSRSLDRATVALGQRWLAPLDRLRMRLIHAAGPPAPPLIRSRDKRVIVQGLVFLGLSLISCLLLPMWSLLLGPLLLGIPHLLADLRYLIVQPGLHRRPRLIAFTAPFLLAASLGYGVKAGLLASFGVLLSGSTQPTRRALIAAPLSLLLGAALWFGASADLLFAHAHNGIAVLIWWLYSPGKSGRNGVVLLYLVIVIALYAGLADLAHTTLTPGISFETHRDALAPGLSQGPAKRVVIAFAFAQSMHYLIWLRLIPDERRRFASPRTFVASWRALVHALHAPLLIGAILSATVLIGWALIDLLSAHLGYLRLAAFHGSLELCALVAFALKSHRC